MSKRIYILEDDATRMVRFNRELIGNPVFHAWDAETFINKLTTANERIDLMFLDHDLGGETFVDSSRDDTGMAVVRHLEKNKSNIGTICVHSLNKPAATLMTQRLVEAGYDAYQMPFIYIDEGVIQQLLAQTYNTERFHSPINHEDPTDEKT